VGVAPEGFANPSFLWRDGGINDHDDDLDGAADNDNDHDLYGAADHDHDDQTWTA